MSPVIHAAACQEALARLPKLDRDELRQQWRALYQAEASPHLSRELLVRAVAYRMQELALGGLRAAPQRQLRQFAQQLKANAEVRIRPGPELKPGTRLLREWRERGTQLTDLATCAATLDVASLPRCRIVAGTVAGRSGTLAVQAPASH